jgi:hypothetical protein
VIACLEAELAFYGEVLGFATPGIPPLPLTTLSETATPAPAPATAPAPAPETVEEAPKPAAVSEAAN